ncbi:MAG: type IX secretion system PorP/SprF family membrane protein [Vicingaceae bacterium]|jgi:type IX secretion system PorP/SprF family membrane protein
MRLLKTFLISSLIVVSAAASSQELSFGYYNYMMNRFNMNASFAGNDGNISAILNTKTYHSGFGGAPRNTFFGIHAPINEKQGIGMRVLSDKRGGYELNKYDAVYSYQIQIDDKSDLRFGMSAGIIRRMLNSGSIDNVELLNQADPTLRSGYFDESNFVAGVGLVYDYENLQLGISSPHLVDGSKELSKFIVGSVSYKYKIEESDFELKPLFIYQNMPEIDNQFDFILKGEFREKFWVQVGYQSTQNLNLGLGFDFGPFGVGYSYEMNNSEVSNIARGSNEILIKVAFESKNTTSSGNGKTVKTLDNFIYKLSEMLNDKDNSFDKHDVYAEIQRIKIELDTLEKENNKKKAQVIMEKLDVIEFKIGELEKKYKK